VIERSLIPARTSYAEMECMRLCGAAIGKALSEGRGKPDQRQHNIPGDIAAPQFLMLSGYARGTAYPTYVSSGISLVAAELASAAAGGAPSTVGSVALTLAVY
jgi:hypothetical protein